MSKPIITADNLGKAYRLGVKIDKNATFRDAIVSTFKSPLKKLKARRG